MEQPSENCWSGKTKTGKTVTFKRYDLTEEKNLDEAIIIKGYIGLSAFLRTRSEQEEMIYKILKKKFEKTAKTKYQNLSQDFFSWWQNLEINLMVWNSSEIIDELMPTKVRQTDLNIDQCKAFMKEWIDYITLYMDAYYYEWGSWKGTHQWMNAKIENQKLELFKNYIETTKEKFTNISPQFIVWLKLLNIDWPRVTNGNDVIKQIPATIRQTFLDIEEHSAFVNGWISRIQGLVKKYNEARDLLAMIMDENKAEIEKCINEQVDAIKQTDVTKINPEQKNAEKKLASHTTLIIAFIDGKAVGFAEFTDIVAFLDRNKCYKLNDVKSILDLCNHKKRYDDQHLGTLAIDPSAQKEGLSRELIFSIIKLFPDTKRITLSAGNSNACGVYTHLRFGTYEEKRFGYQSPSNQPFFCWMNPGTAIERPLNITQESCTKMEPL